MQRTSGLHVADFDALLQRFGLVVRIDELLHLLGSFLLRLALTFETLLEVITSSLRILLVGAQKLLGLGLVAEDLLQLVLEGAVEPAQTADGVRPNALGDQLVLASFVEHEHLALADHHHEAAQHLIIRALDQDLATIGVHAFQQHFAVLGELASDLRDRLLPFHHGENRRMNVLAVQVHAGL